MFDLRLPSGLFFLLLGLVLVGFGAAAGDAHAPLTTVNVNLYTGAFMILFGGILLWLSRRKAS
ncbi:MAG TPA: hypothetical protein DEH78_02570 [Solibacterales bacterium]|nr:hypothetical protein [Bryobacterales bacterium]